MKLVRILSTKTLLLFILIGIFLAFFYWSNAKNELDPDFGWHLRMGQVISSTGIPQKDPFSYTMPSYPFVDHEWLTDVMISKVYPYTGIQLLLFLSIFFVLSALFLQAVITQTKWALLPLFVSGTALVGHIGIRPQIISWLFFSVLLVICLGESRWKRFRWGTPLLFLAWANLHGSFPLGLLTILITIIVRSIEQKKVIFSDYSLFVLCGAVTFINPYGLRIWWEIWMQLSSNQRWVVQEWFPTFLFFNYEFLIAFTLSLILLVRYRKHFSWLTMIMYAFLFFLGASSDRNIPFWLLIAISVMTKGLHLFYLEAKKNKLVEKRFVIAYLFFSSFVIAIVTMHLGTIVLNSESHALRYPLQAIHFLKIHPSQGNLISTYEWGGFLIWKYPEKKVFIDGRMPSWRRSNAPVGESTNALQDYESILRAEPSTIAILVHNHVDTMLLPLSDAQGLRKTLEKLHMKRIYKDSFAVVYRDKGLSKEGSRKQYH